jgi:transposase
MSKIKRNKFSIADKERAVKLYLSEGYSYCAIAKALSTSDSLVSLWVKNYEKYGKSGLSFRNDIHYSPEYKLDILQEIEQKKLSLLEASVEYHISPSVIRSWRVQYSKYGESGLSLKRKGRPPKNKQKELSQTSNNDYEQLLERNKYLEAEVAYLKKLDALIQSKRQ